MKRSPVACCATFGLSAVVLASLTACGGDSGGTSQAAAAPTVTVLSTGANYVMGGTVMVAVSGTGTLAVKLNGTDVSSAFKTDPQNAGQMIGVVTGLVNGNNTLTASVGGGTTAAVALTNYPVTGPILSGPHISPFICQTNSFLLPDGTTLGPPTDTDCSAPTKINYVYESTAGGALKSMPVTTSLPSDVAMTTNTLGVQVPFVVRVETGTMNRGIYQNAVLHDPTSDAAPSPTTPPKGWNRRLIANHGSGCPGGWYIQGAAMGVNPLTGDNLLRLGEGYGIFINTLNHPTNSCNAILAGETTMMGKQHFIEEFGVPFYTVSTGGSGGAYTSLQIADTFPGLFDGVAVSATFPEALAIAENGLDDKLMSHYLYANDTSGITESQMVAVTGHLDARAWYDAALQSGRTDPVPGRTDPTPASPILGAYASAVWNAAVPIGLRYDPVSNPTGARPTVFDIARNIYGTDTTTGFAHRPYDNVGVQYGLNALNAGTITPDQFIDLNAQVGGYDQDGNYTSFRSVGDIGAIKRVYQGGLQLSGGGGLASIPVFDYSGLYDDGELYHYQWYHFAVRARLVEANGNSDNHVMWRGAGNAYDAISTPTAIGAALNSTVSTQSWAMFIKWMEAYKADTSSSSQRDKVIADKPAGAVDGCFTKSTTPQFIAETQTRSSLPTTQCNTLYPSYSVTRIEAGGPASADKLKCTLKPVSASDYQVAFTPAQILKLNTVFPTGVCDWTQPGINQVPLVTYPSFGPSPVNLVFDVTKQ